MQLDLSAAAKAQQGQQESQLADQAAALAAQLEKARGDAEAAKAQASAARGRNALLEKAWTAALQVGGCSQASGLAVASGCRHLLSPVNSCCLQRASAL